MAVSDYYSHTTYPANGAQGSASAMRSELESIETGISAKLPDLSGNGGKIVAINSGATALEAVTTTGTGSAVRATSPTLVTPTIGVATATSINKVALTAPATSCTFTLLDGKTFTVNNTLTFAGTDGSTLNIGTGGTLGTAAFTAASAYVTAIGTDATLTRWMLKDCGLPIVDKGNSGTSTQTLDYTEGSHQKVTATGNFTLALSNAPPTGNLGLLLIEAVNFGGYTVTLPTINWVQPDGTLTTTFATYLAANLGRTALQTSGTDFILLWTRDASTVYGKLV
jgi:hypothetical protein